jgi:hypothetical protein
MSKATTPDKPRIGWIGLGKMGLPICQRLAAQQFKLTTLTRNPEGRARADRGNLQGESKIGGVCRRRPNRRFRHQRRRSVARHRLRGRRTRGDAKRLADFRGDQHGLSERLPTRRRSDVRDRGGLRSFARIRLDDDGRSRRAAEISISSCSLGNRAYRGPVKRQDLMNQRHAVAGAGKRSAAPRPRTAIL